jgi:hypothetical protein
MATYAVDSKRQAMTATGIVNSTPVWEDTGEGKRRPNRDIQARDEDTGMPLWEVEVRYVMQMFGEDATVVHKVTVGHEKQPAIQPDTSIEFDGLTVDANVSRHGTFSERWRAEGLGDFTPMSAARTASTSKEKAA